MNLFNSKLQKMRLTPRLILIYGVTFLMIVVMIVSMINFSVRNIITDNIERELMNSSYLMNSLIQTAADTSIKNHLRTTSENSLETAEFYYGQYLEGVLSEEQAKEKVLSSVKPLQIGTTGYIYLMDSQGLLVYHPYEELENTNISEYQFAQTQMKEKSGYVEYMWQNPDDIEERAKVLYMSYFEPWDWIISASSYKSEFSDLVNLSDFEEKVTSIKFGDEGYPILLDDTGTFLVHPSLKGRNMIEENDPQRSIIEEVLEKRNGILEYDWKNPNDKKSRRKFVVYSEIKEFKWIIASSAYKDDFYEVLNELTEIIAVASGIGLFVLILLTVKISAMVIKPLKKLEETVLEGVKGDLSVRVEITGDDEVNQLGGHFNQFIETLETKNIILEEEISKRKVSAEELEHLNKNLERVIDERTEELYIVQGELVQRERLLAINKLIKDIAHGMNTPLGNSITATSFLEKIVKHLNGLYSDNNLSKQNFEKFFEDFDESYTVLVKGLKKSASLINMFKLITRDSATLQSEEFNVHNEIEKTIALLKHDNIQIVLYCNDKLTLNSFPRVMNLIISNLVANALLHGYQADAKGRISIIVSEKGNGLEIIIDDDGNGMEETELEKVFNPFYTTRPGENIGLGLSVVYHSIHSIMMGSIKLRNKSKGGLEIIIEIPNIQTASN